MKAIGTALIIFSVMLAGRVTAAVSLKPTPVQTELRSQLWSGGESSFNDAFTSPKEEREESSWGIPRQEKEGKKTVGKAILYSLVLPGWGEYYAGQKRKARVFFTVEALTWLGYFSFRTYGGWKRDDYIHFARERANAQLEGKNDWFIDIVGFYDDIDEYNTFGRVFDPDRPYLEDTPENHWRWQSPADRDIYRHLKNRSREAYRRANFMIGVAIVNRVLSIIDAVRDVKRAQARQVDSFGITERLRMKIDVDPFRDIQRVRLTFFTPW